MAGPLMVLRRVREWLAGHTRWVSTPLYRLMVLGAVISGVCQTVWGVPISLAGLTSGYFDWAFVVVQILSGVLTLAGLYLVEENNAHATRLYASLHLELVGLIGMQTAIAMNVVAVILYYREPPAGMGSWFQIMFWLWAWVRIVTILRMNRKLAR